jgi:tetratricopeptide (TPR) repeat protein
MKHFFSAVAFASILLVGCQPAALNETEVLSFIRNFDLQKSQGEESIAPFISGVASDFSFFNASNDSAFVFEPEWVEASWFDQDTVYTEVQLIQIDGAVAQVYGVNVEVYDELEYRAKFSATIAREAGTLVWKRWMHVEESQMATTMMDPTTDSEVARDAYWEMYNSLMRNDFLEASAHADTVLQEDASLALAYVAKILDAGWVKGDEVAYDKAQKAGLEAIDNESIAEQSFMTAFTSEGKVRMEAAMKALAYAPQDPLIIAYTAYWLGDGEESVALLERGLKRWPKMGAFHNLMGYRMMAEENMEAAKMHLVLQTRFMADAANPWDSMGDYYVAVDNKEEAIKCFEKALEIDPAFSDSQDKIDELNGKSADAS